MPATDRKSIDYIVTHPLDPEDCVITAAIRQMTAAGTSRDVYHLGRSDLIIGREQGDIVFSDDEFMSRRHALLQFRSNRAMISDQGSSNGTYVRLTGQHILDPGQMIRLGDELLRFELG